MANDPQTREALRCCECGRLWLDDSERWRAYLDDEGQAVTFCPECAQREFSDDD